MNWIFSHFQLLIFLFVVFSVIRAALRAAKLSSEHKAGESETGEQRRVREIQERIRKTIAERRGGRAPLAPVPTRTGEPATPMLRPMQVPPLEPFGGPSRRLVIESMRRATPTVEPPVFDPAVLERQQQLAEQVRALEEARIVTERRAAQVVAQTENAAASSSVASARAAGWLGDLRDPRALRRAFVMREVLGAPVALR